MKPSKYFFTFLFFANLVFAQEQELKDTLKKTLSSFESINQDPILLTCDNGTDLLGQETFKDPGGSPFKVSVVNEEYAKKIFDYLASQKHIPFRYPEDGCQARAHEMARILDKFGITTGKVFIEGALKVQTPHSLKGYVKWQFHTAIFLAVKDKSGKTSIQVFDPTLFNHPVSRDEWEKIQTTLPETKKTGSFQTSRFHYLVGDAAQKLTDYKKEDLARVQYLLKLHMAIQTTQENMAKFEKMSQEMDKR